MISYEEMQYLIAFAKSKTLSEVAEQFHISQPTITRAMKHIEEEFGAGLFERTKNSIKLSDVGLLAAEEAALVVKQTDSMLRRVHIFERAGHTIAIGSSAAVQIPDLIRRISQFYPDMTISTELKKPSVLINKLKNDNYQLIILPYKPKDEDVVSFIIGEEHLMFLLPNYHKFAKSNSLTLADMDGESMLLFSEIGFWHDIVTEMMPNSRFLLQSERYSLEELIANSVLSCFTTDLACGDNPLPQNRVGIPISDPQVNVTYYLVCKKENQKRFSALFK